MAVKPTRFDWKNERLLMPAGAIVLAAAVLFPLLGSYGLWDPQEITVADAGRELADKGGWLALLKVRPPLHTWLIAGAVKAFGTSELSVRLPIAFLGLLGALATYALGARLRRPRVGLLAVLVLCASPLFVFESRQLTSGVGALTGGAAALLGLAGLTWPSDDRRRPLAAVLDVILVVAGLTVGFLSAGLLVGVLVPLVAAAVAAAFAVGSRRAAVAPDAPSAKASAAANAGEAAPLLHRDRRFLVAIVTGSLAVVILGVALAAIYDVVRAGPGQRAIFGRTLATAKSYLPLLGGAFRPNPTPGTATFDDLIKQVAFGMFPWAALAPLAVLRLSTPERRDRAAWGGLLLVFWATAAYVIGTIWTRKVGALHYPALPAIAVAVALYLDDVLGEEETSAGGVGKDTLAAASARALPLAALFAFAAAVQLSRDLFQFPDELVSVHLLSTLKFPGGRWLLYVVLGLGVVFAILLSVGLGLRRRPRLEALDGLAQYGKPGRALRATLSGLTWPFGLVHGRRGVLGATGVSVAFGLFLAWGFTPAMSQHFSYRNLFQSYFDHRTGSEPLGVMGIQGSGPEYYAHGPYMKLPGRAQLVDFLRQAERVFAITPASELCAVHQAAGQPGSGFAYHVLDNRSSRFLLLTNRLLDREHDQNPLLKAIRRAPPATIAHPLSATFEDDIELLGYDMPAAVKHGETFQVTLYFKVVGKPGLNYKIFAHFDTRGSRFQGDHEPIAGRCGTTWWQPGDYVVDTFDVKAGELTSPKGSYTVFFGFFTGGSGQWKNMKVTSGNGDTNNRVQLGTIKVR